MQRILFLFAVFIPAMTKANQREPFFLRLKEPVIRTEKPVIDTEAYYKFVGRSQPPYEYIFTAKPITEPVTMKPVATESRIEKTFMDIPAYILKSVELNDNNVKENEVNIEDLFTNVRPRQIEKIEIPIVEKNVLNQPIKQDTASYVWKSEDDFLPNDPATYYINGFPRPKIAEKVVNNPQLPVLTEKPVFEHNALSNKVRLGPPFLPHLPVFTKNSLNAPVNGHKERLLKGKLVSLFLSSKKDLERQIRNTQSIHNTYKSGTLYRIGYLTSLINKMNNRIKKQYKTVQHNQHNWDSLRILEAYEQIKRDNDTIQELLKMMQSYLRATGKSGLETLGEGAADNKQMHSKGISWSYYDDSLV